MVDWIDIIPEYRIYFVFPVFLIGASIASFYFNLAHRISVYFYTQERKRFQGWSRWKQILFHPSNCEDCNTPIPSLHLIPILGYFLTRGECPQCGYKIPILYPLGEFFFGVFGVFLFFIHPHPMVSLLFLLLMGHLMISMFTDVRYFSLDYENLIWILLWGFGLNLLLTESLPGIEDGMVFLGFLGFFLIIHLFYPKGMGLGDVLFAPAFAFLAGHPWWLFFLNLSYIPAVLITILLRKKGESIREIPIPMGLYFCLGLFFTFTARLLYETFGIELNYD